MGKNVDLELDDLTLNPDPFFCQKGDLAQSTQCLFTSSVNGHLARKYSHRNTYFCIIALIFIAIIYFLVCLFYS